MNLMVIKTLDENEVHINLDQICCIYKGLNKISMPDGVLRVSTLDIDRIIARIDGGLNRGLEY